MNYLIYADPLNTHYRRTFS